VLVSFRKVRYNSFSQKFLRLFYFLKFKLDEFWVCYGDHYQANLIQGLIKSARMTRLEVKDKVS